MSEPLWLPSLSHFSNGNGWTGSEGVLRFQLEPPIDGQITAVVWQDPFTRVYAEELYRADFPLTDEGRAAMSQWLRDRAAEMNANPPRSKEELRAYYDKMKTEEAAG